MNGKLVGSIGDIGVPEEAGGRVYETSPGHFELEWIEPPPDDRRMEPGTYDAPDGQWTIYGVLLDPEIPDWGDLRDAARSVGMPWMELADAFMSTDPIKRAYAYETWASYYGWHELDSYPTHLYRSEVEKRFKTELYPSASWIKVKSMPYTMGSVPVIVAGKTLLFSSLLVTPSDGSTPFNLLAPAATAVDTHLFEIENENDSYYVLIVADFVFLGKYDSYDPDDPRPAKADREIMFDEERDIRGVFPEIGNSADLSQINITHEEMIRRLSKWLD